MLNGSVYLYCYQQHRPSLSDPGYFGTQLAFTKVHHGFPSLTPEDNNMKIKTNTKAGSAVWGG
jgi:hypothetical protein